MRAPKHCVAPRGRRCRRAGECFICAGAVLTFQHADGARAARAGRTRHGLFLQALRRVGAETEFARMRYDRLMATPDQSLVLPPDDRVRPRLDTLIRLAAPASALPLHRSTVRALQSGQYLSRFRGRGMEFDETRPYVAGDDVRSLDWRVTARTGRVHTKLFREERERPVLLAVDCRASMFFGTRGAFKSVIAAQLAALIAWSAHHRGDRVGGVIFSEAGRIEVKPEHSRRAVLRLLRELTEASPRRPDSAGHDALQDALNSLDRHTRTGSLIFVFSDFRGFDADTAALLTRLRRHGDTVLIMLYDPLEQSLPSDGRYHFGDGSRDIEVDLNPRKAGDYAERFAQRVATLRLFARSGRMRFLLCATDEDPVRVLQRGIARDRHHL